MKYLGDTMIAEELVQLRKARGLTQQGLANEIAEKIMGDIGSLSQKAIERMENGRTPVAWYVVKYFHEK